MENSFTQCYENGLNFAFDHYEKFLAICPDKAWGGKTGGWTLGQQYYHGLMATAMLISTISGTHPANPNPEAGKLEEKPDILATKEQAAQFLANIRAAAASLCNSLTDSELLKKNEIVSRKFGRDVNNAEVLELIACHLLYHLGCCDCGLRERNLPGSW